MAEDINIKIQVDSSQAQSSTENYKKRLKDLKDEMTRLQVETDGLSKASAEQRKRFSQLEQEAGKIADAMADASQRVKNLSDDYRGMTIAMEGIGGAVGGITAVQGALNLFGIESEQANESIKKMTSLLGILQGVQNVSKALNKDSALMTALVTAKNKLLTTSIQEQTTAQLALNAAKLGMVGAITAVVAALTVLIAKYASAKNEAAELAKTIDNNVAESLSKIIPKVNKLKDEFNELGDNLNAKKKYYEAHKKEILEIDGALDTYEKFENAIINNTDKYIEAQKQRARAEAARALVVENTKKMLEEELKNERLFGDGQRTFMEEVALGPLELAYRLFKGKDALAKAGQAIGDQIQADGEKDIATLNNIAAEAEKTANEIFNSLGLGGSSGDDDNDDPIKKIEEKYNKLATTIKLKYFDAINQTEDATLSFISTKKQEGELIDNDIKKLEEQNKHLSKNSSQYKQNELQIKQLQLAKSNLYKVEVAEDDEQERLDQLVDEAYESYKKEKDTVDELAGSVENLNIKLGDLDEDEEQMLQDEENRQKKLRAIREASLNSATMLLDYYNDYLDRSYDEELQMAEGNEKKQAEIKKRYAKQKFLTQIASIAISTSQAILATWAAFAEVPIAAAIQSAAIGALGIAQTAQAQKEMNKALKAERGGILGGQSHANGGTMLSNGVEAERGEAIINKRSTAAFAPLLSEINSYRGYGAPLISSAPSTGSALQSTVSDETIQRIVSATVQGIASIPVVVSEHAITEAQRTVGITRERSFI